MTNHVAAPTVTHVCNHKTHGLRFVFCSGTKHKSESLFLCFKYELQVRLVCNQHLLSWKHTACLETLVYQKFLTIYGSFNTLKRMAFDDRYGFLIFDMITIQTAKLLTLLFIFNLLIGAGQKCVRATPILTQFKGKSIFILNWFHLYIHW